MKEIMNDDIVMADDSVKCKVVSEYRGFGLQEFTHDAVVVGLGSQSIYSYWLVKQSWGGTFMH